MNLEAAVSLLLDKPWERKGYDDLERYYEAKGMEDEAELLRFLVLERFGADSSGAD